MKADKLSDKEKKVVYPHIVLLIGGRFLLVFGICTCIFMTYKCAEFSIRNGKAEPVWFFYLLFSLVLDVVWWYVCRFLWHQCFEKLIVTKEGLEWRCLFQKSVKLRYSEIKYFDVRIFDEGNVLHNSPSARAYSVFYEYLVVSANDVSRVSTDKIRSSREKQIIRFRLSRRACQALSERYPAPRNRIFEAKLRKYTGQSFKYYKAAKKKAGKSKKRK